jgi:hypothetical protein
MFSVTKTEKPFEAFEEIQRSIEDSMSAEVVDIETHPLKDWYRST